MGIRVQSHQQGVLGSGLKENNTEYSRNTPLFNAGSIVEKQFFVE